VQRVSVVGTPGSGKTQLAGELGKFLGLSVLELDGLFHQPSWAELDQEEFRRRVEKATAGSDWIVDGNYAAVRDIIWSRADTIVWLDLPRRTVMRRVVIRTVRRVITRQSLWNGNREPFANLYRFDDRNIIRWAWTTHHSRRVHYEAVLADFPRPGRQVFRLRSVAEVGQWLREVTTSDEMHRGKTGTRPREEQANI
jgi:adenylate kinase family enzyme